MEKQKPGMLAKAFETHPQTPDRIKQTQEEINTLLPPRAEYKVDTSEFEDVKARLAKMENRHKIEQGQIKIGLPYDALLIPITAPGATRRSASNP